MLITNACSDRTLIHNNDTTEYCDDKINHNEGTTGHHDGTIGQCDHKPRYSGSSVWHEDGIIEYCVGTIWFCDVTTSNAVVW